MTSWQLYSELGLVCKERHMRKKLSCEPIKWFILSWAIAIFALTGSRCLKKPHHPEAFQPEKPATFFMQIMGSTTEPHSLRYSEVMQESFIIQKWNDTWSRKLRELNGFFSEGLTYLWHDRNTQQDKKRDNGHIYGRILKILQGYIRKQQQVCLHSQGIWHTLQILHWTNLGRSTVQS